MSSPHDSRSSVDAPQTPHSPGSTIHNIASRFRKGSSASRASSQSSDHLPVTPDPAERAETAQSAKRFLLSVVRNDWEYPPRSDNVDPTYPAREPVSYHTREMGASDLDSDHSSGQGVRKRRASNPYKFDNPDAVGTTIQDRRRRKRRKLEEEMRFNEGLRTWALRRDAWTGAVPHKPGQIQLGDQDNMNHVNGTSHTKSARLHDSSSSTGTDEFVASTRNSPLLPQLTSTSSLEPGSTVVGSNKASRPQPPLDGTSDGPYLPIYPPLFPISHTLRSRIKPSTYPTIYSKVVLQAMTPNIPIPLTHMIGALVHGWKSEGNWPPTTLAEQQAMAAMTGGKKPPRKHESAFGRWRREQDERRKLHHISVNYNGQLVPPQQTNGMGGQEDEAVGKKGIRHSISGAVKKVFGMNEPNPTAELDELGLTFEEEEEDDAGLGLESELADNRDLNGALVESKAG